MVSQLEETLLLHIRASGLPEPEREVQFHTRKWRFDLCWPERIVTVRWRDRGRPGGYYYATTGEA